MDEEGSLPQNQDKDGKYSVPIDVLKVYVNPNLHAMLEIPLIRREREKQILHAESEYQKVDRFFKRRTDSRGDIQFPNQTLAEISQFSRGRVGQSGESFHWTSFENFTFNLKGDEQLTAGDSIQPIIPATDAMPDRSGSVHSHPNSLAPSTADISFFMFDSASSVMFITTQEEIYILRKTVSPIEFAKKFPEKAEDIVISITDYLYS